MTAEEKLKERVTKLLDTWKRNLLEDKANEVKNTLLPFALSYDVVLRSCIEELEAALVVKTCACQSDHPMKCKAMRYGFDPDEFRGDPCYCTCHGYDPNKGYSEEQLS